MSLSLPIPTNGTVGVGAKNGPLSAGFTMYNIINPGMKG